jgi:hypothetical protein
MLRKLTRPLLLVLLVFVTPALIFAGSVGLLAQDTPEAPAPAAPESTTPARPTGLPEGYMIIEGDIAVPIDFYAKANSPEATFTIDPWRNGIVPYAFDPAVSSTNRNRAIAAMAEWEAVAGLDFIPRTTEPNYIYIINSTGNWSYVGQIGGGQEIGIYSWTFRFVIAHELAHAGGWWHEQSRPDRNSYVQINNANIATGYAHNFNIQAGAYTFGPYDFESIMHYSQYAFSSNGQPTITVLPPNQGWQNLIGQRNYLSERDKQGMAYLYPASLHNGDFSAALNYWGTYAQPAGALTAAVNSGVLEFRRNPGGTQAVLLQTMNANLDTADTLEVTLQIGNSSPYRKRISVLLHTQTWSDNQICAFWLPANAPLRTFTMRVRPTLTWIDPQLSLYASSTEPGTGNLRVDNIRITNAPTLQSWTYCIDPLAPNPVAGADSANLLLNGNFASPLTTGWTAYGQMSYQVNGGVFESHRLAGAPSGTLFQETNTSAPANTPLELTFQMGNPSPERLRATILLHDSDFSDSQACTFWLAPNTPLSNYMIRTYTTKAWSNVTLSYYPSTVPTVAGRFLQLDNLSLRRRPGIDVNGTHCYIPGTLPADAATYEDGFDSAAAPAIQAQPALPPGELPIIATPVPFDAQSEGSGEGQLTEGG